MKHWTTVVLAMIFSFLFCVQAFGDGGIMPSEESWKQMRERSMINEPEQKAVVFFSKGKEELIISPSYEGSARDFAWVVPVPAKPKVEILKGAIFHELASLVPPPRLRKDKNAKSMAAGAQSVTVIERKIVGAYDVSVLSATDAKSLVKWLKANKYHLPDAAKKPIDYYVKKGWTFVACRVKTPESAKGLKSGTLAPIRLTFKTNKPIYPIRLSSINPERFSVLVYLIVPANEIGATNSISLASFPGRNKFEASTVYATLHKGQKKYPTVAKLSHDKLKIFMLKWSFAPEDCTKDITWALPRK